MFGVWKRPLLLDFFCFCFIRLTLQPVAVIVQLEIVLHVLVAQKNRLFLWPLIVPSNLGIKAVVNALLVTLVKQINTTWKYFKVFISLECFLWMNRIILMIVILKNSHQCAHILLMPTVHISSLFILIKHGVIGMIKLKLVGVKLMKVK